MVLQQDFIETRESDIIVPGPIQDRNAVHHRLLLDNFSSVAQSPGST